MNEKFVPEYIVKTRFVFLGLAIFVIPMSFWSFQFVAFLAPIGFALWLLFPLRWRSYYYDVKPFKGELPPEFANRKRRFILKEHLEYSENPSQCKLCKKHPVNKKYHLAKVHKISGSIPDYFITCGCNRCLKVIDLSVASA